MTKLEAALVQVERQLPDLKDFRHVYGDHPSQVLTSLSVVAIVEIPRLTELVRGLIGSRYEKTLAVEKFLEVTK